MRRQSDKNVEFSIDRDTFNVNSTWFDSAFPPVTFSDRFQTVSKLSTRPLVDKRRTRVAPPDRSLPVACSRTVEQTTRSFVK